MNKGLNRDYGLCNILDHADLMDILKNFHEEDAMVLRLRNELIQKDTKWFIFGDACMCYEPLGFSKYQAHIYCVSRDNRGRALVDFAVRTGRWMVDNTDCISILNFVKKDRRDIQFFMRMIGSKKVGRIPGTEDILYVSTGDMGIKEK